MKRSEERPLLHTVRWMSAAVVAFGHALSLAFERSPYDFLHNPVGSLISYGADLGPAAVMLFFVISGYLVGGGVIERQKTLDLFAYWASRFSRIYIALAPAIALTIALDGLAYLIDPHSLIYTTGWAPPVAHPIFASYTPRNILATLLSLENFIGEPFGSNRPLWSLGYEWAFYFLLPLTGLALNALGRSNLKSWIVAALLIALPMLLLHHIFMALFWMIWLAGAVARQFAGTTRVPTWIGLAGAALTACGVLASPLIDQRIAFPTIGVGFSLFVCCPELLKHSMFGAFDRKLADCSFSLYISHLPLLTFTCFLLSKSGIYTVERYPAGIIGLTVWLGLCALATAAALVFGGLFEARTEQFRQEILRLRRARPVPA